MTDEEIKAEMKERWKAGDIVGWSRLWWQRRDRRAG